MFKLRVFIIETEIKADKASCVVILHCSVVSRITDPDTLVSVPLPTIDNIIKDVRQ